MDATSLSATFENLQGVASAQLNQETTGWAEAWEQKAPLPGVARWIGQRIRRTEELLGSGAAETGFFIGQLGSRAVRQVPQLGSQEREGFFEGMNEATRLFVRGLRSNSVVPEREKLRNQLGRELAAKPDVYETFSRAVNVKADLVLPWIEGYRPFQTKRTLSLDGLSLAPGAENLVTPVTMFVVTHRSPDHLAGLQYLLRMKQGDNILIVADHLEPGEIEELTQASESRCWFLEPRTEKVREFWHYAARVGEDLGRASIFQCKASAVSFEPKGARILGPWDAKAPEWTVGLTAPIEAHNPEWSFLDRTFRSYRECTRAGCVEPGTLGWATEFLRHRLEEIPEDQISGAQAVLDATEELGSRGIREPLPLSVVEEALEGAAEAVISLLSETPQAASADPPRVELIRLTGSLGPLSGSLSQPVSFGLEEGPPGAGDPPEEPVVPDEQERILDVLLTGEVWEGLKVTLTATVRLPASESVGQFQETFGVAPSLGPVRFCCEVSGFELLTPASVLRVIPESEDAETVTFILKVAPAASRWIELSLFQQQKLLTQVTISEFQLTEIERRQVLRRAGEVDLMLTVDEDGEVRADSPKDREDLSDFAMGAFTPWSIDYQARLAAEITRLFDQEDPRKVDMELRYIGAELRKLMPSALVEKLASPRVRTVFIRHGVANAFPFEFVLLDDGKDESFLGDRLAVCRWLRGIENAPRSDAKEIRRIALLKGNVDVAQREVDLLQGFCAETRVFASPESVREEVLACQSFELLHFIGHCKCSEKGQSCLELEKGDLRLREIGTLREYQAFGEASPFIFLNGCGTAHPGYSLFGPDSFPHRFLQHKASVFLGTLWPVSKTVAHDFSREFYGRLVQGTPLGQALIESRRELLASTTSPEDLIRLRISLRSYCLFAHPAMRVAFQRAA